MTMPSDAPTPDDEGVSRDAGSGESEKAPGVELGMSDGPGGTFEPEEDAASDG